MSILTSAMFRALARAASRESGNICPTPSHAAAQTALLNALDRRGFIVWDNPEIKSIPRISDAGRAALIKAQSGAAP